MCTVIIVICEFVFGGAFSVSVRTCTSFLSLFSLFAVAHTLLTIPVAVAALALVLPCPTGGDTKATESVQHAVGHFQSHVYTRIIAVDHLTTSTVSHYITMYMYMYRVVCVCVCVGV